VTAESEAVVLRVGTDWPDRGKRALREFVRDGQAISDQRLESLPYACRAALLVLRDLRRQGWSVRWKGRSIEAIPPSSAFEDAEEMRQRVRLQEQLKRDEQLSQAPVRRFVEGMEAPREFRGRFVSIANLMRDGADLAEAIAASGVATAPAIRPYLVFPMEGDRCPHTGFRLLDVWRYFRLTWSNQYVSTPGRSMPILVRDAAADDHPIIGIAALGSAIVQIEQRDAVLGWNSTAVVERARAQPSDRFARWLQRRLTQWFAEVFVDDLRVDGLLTSDWQEHPESQRIDALRIEAERCRRRHQRLGGKADFRSFGGGGTDAEWEERAQTDLYRSRRCALLVDLLSHAAIVRARLGETATAEKLSEALAHKDFERSVRWIARRAKAESVGTEIADLTVCGAVAPYNEILGGKLVSVLATSPTVVRAYRARYSGRASEIASSIAGRRIERSANLAFIGTTSLYGAGASQYNRITVPTDATGWAAPLRFRRLGRSKSYGTSHFSAETVRALSDLVRHPSDGMRVKGIFGEGSSPKLRRVREGFDALGWDSDQLLRHRRERLVFGVELINNVAEYLLGMDTYPDWRIDPNDCNDVSSLTEWWTQRWVVDRFDQSPRQAALRSHRVGRPLQHGARVQMPELAIGTDEQ
jgi:Druantia protein DruA